MHNIVVTVSLFDFSLFHYAFFIVCLFVFSFQASSLPVIGYKTMFLSFENKNSSLFVEGTVTVLFLP
jgi:hypothetical protein